MAEVRPNHGPEELPLDVVERFRRRDADAFREVYGLYAASVRRWAGAWFSRPFDREEAVQEVWLTVHRVANAYVPARGSFRPWLRTVALNRCKELLRARGRRIPLTEDIPEDMASPDANPDSDVRRSRLREAVAQFARTLGHDEATVMKLSLAEDLPLEEVSRQAGIKLRRSKYLKKKLLLRAVNDPGLRRALAELVKEEA